jgi:hypothetical protein
MCVTPDEVSNGCDNFVTTWQPQGNILGYTQGTYPITNLTPAGTWELNTYFPGMYGLGGQAQFSFSGANQTLRYKIYTLLGQTTANEQFIVAVNGSSPIAVTYSTLPVTIGGVTISLDTTLANTTGLGWDDAYLTLTGNINTVTLSAFEAGIKEMCVTSIAEIAEIIDATELTLYPNPATSILNVSTNKITVQKIEILDMNGRVVLANQLENSINVSFLVEGMYTVVVYHNEGAIIDKFIKQ